jgi:gamma-glutamylcyclotransferase (GGCT)/AIG2-like uncharacterized protein YtfP
MGDYLFSYGTLLPGRTPNEIAAAVEKLRPVGDGFVRAVLYDLGDYPGAVLDPSSQQIVAGTVFQLPEDEDVLRQLDEYEGFNPDAPGKSLFIRARCPVTLASGSTLECWIYVYNGELDPVRVMESGIYRNPRKLG